MAKAEWCSEEGLSRSAGAYGASALEHHLRHGGPQPPSDRHRPLTFMAHVLHGARA